jgi:ubiquinone/menaquinone biosynthesis C-methylase UbiE
MADLQPGERVIDIACGTGLVTLPAARMVGASGYVLGLDISASMVAEASAIAFQERLDHVQFARADAENLGDADGFDVSLCSLGLMYVPAPVGALNEMHRVLRPSGRVVVSVWGERRNCGWAELFPIIDARVHSEVCPMFFSLGTPGAIEAALERAQFVEIESTRLSVELVYRDDDEAVGAAFLGGPVALAYGRLSAADKIAAEHDYLNSLAAYHTSDGYRVPGEFVIASARV